MTNAKLKELNVISVEKLKEFLSYNPETGVFVWIKSPVNHTKIGDTAGSPTVQKYNQIMIGGIGYKAHRLAWLYMTDKMPDDMIDHINGDRTDNRFCNLREATRRQNQQNQTKPQKGNKSGYLGVASHKSGKYEAKISINGKIKYLGLFVTPEEAHQVYLNAKREMHPFCTI